MIILSAIDTAQEITVAVREHTVLLYTVTIIDEQLNSKSSDADVLGTYSDGQLTIEIAHDFIEDNFYAVQIFSDGDMICFHKIYVTDQEFYDKYSVLNDYYTEPTKDKTNYIVKQ